MIKTYGYTDNTQLSPHFNAQEFRCKCGKEHDFQIDDDLITKLEALYSTLNCSKIIVTSGFRCAAHDTGSVKHPVHCRQRTEAPYRCGI